MSESHNPYSSPQAPVQTGFVPPMVADQKPTAITIFGILHLVFGAFGLCGTGGGVVSLIVMANNPNMAVSNPMLDHPAYQPFAIFSLTVGFALTCVLLAAGCFLLMTRELGRSLSISYAVGSIINILVGIGFQAFMAASVLNAPGLPESVRLGVTVGLAIGTISMLVGLLYPGFTIYFMTRPKIRDYLQKVAERKASPAK